MSPTPPRFEGLRLDPDRLQRAARDARENWDLWCADYLHRGRFRDQPVFRDYPRFRGFGADYAVFRGFTGHEAERMRQWFRAYPDPEGFAPLYAAFQAQRFSRHSHARVSLVSKLLALWCPQDYAMWDQLARTGLKRLHGSTRGHCYTATDARNYAIFNRDFHALHAARQAELARHTWSEPDNPHISRHDLTQMQTARILDNYLMRTGR